MNPYEAALADLRALPWYKRARIYRSGWSGVERWLAERQVQRLGQLELPDYAAHKSWRCTLRGGSCICGLDALTDELGLPRVELTCWPTSEQEAMSRPARRKP